jgi:amino acid adenylation domain-containing protein
MSSSRPTGAAAANFAERLFETAERAGDRPAVVESGGATDYAALAGRALAVAEALAEAGANRGDRVAILLPRGADAAAAFFGVLACGAIAVMVNESLRPRQIEHILGHAGAKILLTTAALTDRLPRAIDSEAPVLEMSELPAVGPAASVRLTGGDVAEIIYTSGSTGLPKGVTISHANLWAGMGAVVEYLGLRESDRIASLLPFSFDYGLNQLLCCVGTGAALVVERSPVPQRIVQTLRGEDVTVLPAVPPLWLQLLSVDSFASEPLPALRLMTNTGGRLPGDAVRKLRAHQAHADLVLMYGLTEAFRSTYLPPEKADQKPNSIGRAIPGAEILVVNEALEDCPPGEAGELVHRGPTVALGYWNDAEATAAVYRPNPLRPPGTPDAERVVFSGDLVYRDDEGDLFFVGRRDRMIKSLGHRLSPDEVADVLYASGEVVEAVVSTEPDELRGALIVAYVVLTPTGELERLEAFCAQEMPRYMRPARIEVRRSLQRTASGKHDVAATAATPDDPS